MGKQVLENKVSLLRHKEYSDHNLVSVKSGESLYILIIVRSDYSMFNATVSVIYCESFHLKNKSWRQKWTGGKSFTVTYEFLFLSFKELEQLASVLSVVNAPIQATVQVIMLIYSGIWYFDSQCWWLALGTEPCFIGKNLYLYWRSKIQHETFLWIHWMNENKAKCGGNLN